MSPFDHKRAWLGALCAILAALAIGSAPAQGAAGDPLFFFVPEPPKAESGKPPPPPIPPPSGYFNGPCGVGVDSFGRFYVADYYHDTVDLFIAPSSPFTAAPTYLGQLVNPDPLNGPCALGLDAANNLYVNIYHQGVARFGASPGFAPGPLFGAEDPTGIAVDPLAGRVYVNERTRIGVYDTAGNPVLEGGEPLVIGEGTLKDGYGLALSRFGITTGYLYVADAATNEVEAYDPARSLTEPVQRISGPPGASFTSLRDSALAVDRISGELYVSEDTQPAHTESPRALVHVFAPDGTYEGHLKRMIITARPPGLAVDNSSQGSQGRVYVTSGNTTAAGLYAYPPAAAVTSAPLPPLGLTGAAAGAGSAAAAGGQSQTASALLSSAGTRASASTIAQKGVLRVAVSGKLSPKRLPRSKAAPIAVSVGGKITTTDESLPPQLKTLRIELNRHGRIDTTGLPTCPYASIQPGSSSRALSSCRSALVGSGSFTANIILAGQDPYPTHGRLLVFNGRQGGKPVLFGHIYAPRPFATSFVIVFAVQKLGRGTYGTVLNAPLPKAMDAWGRLTGLEMTLSRRYSYRGEPHSYLSSGCPAPKGFGLASFPLARTSFVFAGGRKLSSVFDGTCKVRR